MTHATLLILLGVASMAARTNAQAPPLKSVHTVFTTECNQYFNWQVRTPPPLTGRTEVNRAID